MKKTALLAGSIALASLVGCEKAAPDTKVETHQEPGTAQTVRDSAMGLAQEVVGVAEPLLRADLSTRLMGTVLSVSAKEGQNVSAGQVLLRIDGQELSARSSGLAAGLDAARAQLTLAETQAKRMRSLYADSATPKATLDMAESQLAAAKAGLAQIQAQGRELGSVAGYATLVAPFAGKVVARMADPGALAAPGQPLLRVEDASRLRVSVTVSMNAAASLKSGTALDGRIGTKAVKAVVEGVVPSATGNMATVNALVENKDGSLASGSTATLLLPQGTGAVRLVPASALVHEGDLTGVWVRTAQGDDKRWIRVGRAYGKDLEVLSGLRAGETIVVPTSATLVAER